ncbi:hypothetical protein APHAL10511_008147 [Amanita phalloides]|nr:hypothetical protein APHAL10511_008147 [Amanita phalloides]
MANIYTVLNACLYAFILVLLVAFAALSCSIFRKCATRRKVAAKSADVEANTTCATDENRKQPLRLLTLPAKFHLDPVVYPSAARRSGKRLPSYQRVIPNPFRTRSGDKCPSVDTTTIKVDRPKISGSSSDRASHHANNEQPYTAIPTPPCRPSRPTLLDDLLAGFPYEHDVARDLWFPLTNAETGRWGLSVVGGARPVCRYVPRGRKNGIDDLVLALKRGEDKKSVFSIDEVEIDNTPLTPSNTLVDIVVVEKSRKSKKRGEKRRKKNGRSRVHVFEIPELYVNARPYEEIEAEEEARAATEGEGKTIEATIEVKADEEEADGEEALAAREECKFLEVPEPFWA